VTEESSFQAFLATAELAGTEFQVIFLTSFVPVSQLLFPSYQVLN
jgi:hypothetical protein